MDKLKEKIIGEYCMETWKELTLTFLLNINFPPMVGEWCGTKKAWIFQPKMGQTVSGIHFFFALQI